MLLPELLPGSKSGLKPQEAISGFSSRITASASTLNITNAFSKSSSGCSGRKNIPAPALAWPLLSKEWNAWADASGLNPKAAKAAASGWSFPRRAEHQPGPTPGSAHPAADEDKVSHQHHRQKVGQPAHF